MKTANEVVRHDLSYMTDCLKSEFLAMSGKRLLITGGAGFLGHYFVQGALYWNRANPGQAPISVVVYDSFVRGMPTWLSGLKGDANLTLVHMIFVILYQLTWEISPISSMRRLSLRRRTISEILSERWMRM